MQKLLLTDVDDAILEFANPFQDFVEAKGYVGRGRLREFHAYKLEDWLGVSEADANSLMAEFADHDGPLHRRAEPSAFEVLPKLYREGWKMVGITACGVCPSFAARRVQIIAEVFGFAFQGIHFVELRGSKKDILESFKPAVWVEDNYEHALNGARAGHRSFLLDRSYNDGPTGALRDGCEFPIRVRDWHNIYSAIHV